MSTSITLYLQSDIKLFGVIKLLSLCYWWVANSVMCHCQQLAVPCYPKHVIDDINRQISALKAEYCAFVNKLQLLEPDHSVTDHRYRSQLKRASDGQYSVTVFTYLHTPCFSFYHLFVSIFKFISDIETVSFISFICAEYICAGEMTNYWLR